MYDLNLQGFLYLLSTIFRSSACSSPTSGALSTDLNHSSSLAKLLTGKANCSYNGVQTEGEGAAAPIKTYNNQLLRNSVANTISYNCNGDEYKEQRPKPYFGNFSFYRLIK